MSEKKKKLVVSEVTQVVNSVEQLNRYVQENHNLKGQIQYLEKQLKDIIPPLPAANYPDISMPTAPKHAGQLDPKIPHPDCEGHVEIPVDVSTSPVLPPANGKARIMIGVPMLAVSYEFFESFLKFWTELTVIRDPRYEISYHFAYRKPVHMAEEYLVNTAIFNKCTHLLLMDDDIFDVTAADLNKLFDAKKEFISGIMHASKFPHAMCAFRRYDITKRVVDMPADNSMYRLYEIPANCPKCNHGQSHWDAKFCPACGSAIDISIQPADLTPFPFTLIDLKVFDKVKKPWFHCTTGYPTDSWFCDRLLEAGITPYAHMLVRLNHAGITDATKSHYMQMGMAKAQLGKAVVHLSPEQMDLHQSLLVNKMQETEKKLKAKPAFISDKGLAAGSVGDKDLTLVTAAMPR